MAGLIGAALGSFASVLIGRADDPRRVIWAEDGQAARSRCPHCGRTLTWIDLLPLLGWVSARGRCRSCRAPIGYRYLVYEGVGAAVMILAAWTLGIGGALVICAALLPLFIAITAQLYFRRPVPTVYWGIAGVIAVALIVVL